jgi:catechol 2,3-dioxygenase-like lactoylglutathione lyase family enzyme
MCSMATACSTCRSPLASCSEDEPQPTGNFLPAPDEPRVAGVLETALYVSDLASASRFYEEVLGFERVAGDEQRFRALAIGPAQLLLLFRHGSATEPLDTPGGAIPAHDGRGELHVAFAITAASLTAWESRLASHGVEIESRVRWPRGGTSIYFRDPDRHVVELATPGLWPNY